MNIEADIERICQMYLNNLSSIKTCLPSFNVENRHYDKLIDQYQVKTTRSQLYVMDTQLESD